MPFTKVALPRDDLVAGCLVEEDIVILLDHEKLRTDKDLILAAQSCHEIYPSDPKAYEAKKDESQLNSKTYILFTMKKCLILNISEVYEVIDRLKKLLNPPYALEFVDGILNLRGEFITQIDPRQLYSFPKKDIPGAKIVIFRYKDQKYGLVVDTIDEILMTHGHGMLAVPMIKEDDTAHQVSKDVSGCLSVGDVGDTNDTVMVINLAALVSRCVRAGINTD
ncbi:MAG: chemotaxis protein CheW [Mangrovicoccus sp.]